MTIALGINFGTYVFLAADTRVSFYDTNRRLVGYNDDHEKICNTSIGLITGAGSVELLRLVNNRLAHIREISSTDLLLDIVSEARARFRARYSHMSRKYVEETIEKTGWIFSYVTFAEGTFDAGTPVLRLGVIHPSGNILGQRHLRDNCPYVIYPAEARDEDAEAIGKALGAQIKPSEQFKTIRESIQCNGLEIAALIQDISPNFPSISPYCQIGAHTLDGRRGISKVVNPGATKISIRLVRKR